MKTLFAQLVVLLLSSVVAIAAQPDTIHVAKDRPLDMLASIREQVILETVQITVNVEKDGLQTLRTYTATDLIIYQDSTMWKGKGFVYRVPTNYIVSVTTQQEGNVALGAGMGLLVGGVTGGLVGVAVGDASYKETSGFQIFPRSLNQTVGGVLGALIGGLTGALIGGFAVEAKDARTWVFEH